MKGSRKLQTPAFPEVGRPSARLERRGLEIVLGERCINTASGVRADYSRLLWDIREVEQYVEQTHRHGAIGDILSGIKRDFRDSILVGGEKYAGYATDADLKDIISNPHQTPSKLAMDLIAEKIGLAEKTVRTYTKRRKKGKTRRTASRNAVP